MPRDCPRCGSELTQRAFGADLIEGCTVCGGVWFAAGELSRVTRDPAIPLMDIARAFRHALSASDDGAMQCPDCGAGLVEHAFPACPDMPFDVCRQCKGIWLDYGEMEVLATRVIAARPRTEHAQPPPPHSAAHAPAAHPPPAHTPAAHPPPVHAAPHAAPAPEAAPPPMRYVRCPACQSTTPEASQHCWSCGAEMHHEGDRHHRCPCCAATLATIVDDDVRYELCAACAGIWLEDGRLAVFLRLDADVYAHVVEHIAREHVLAERAAAAAAEQAVQLGLARTSTPGPQATGHAGADDQSDADTLRCPACHFEMQAHYYGSENSVHAHICTGCRSTWLEAGQIEAAYELVRQEGFLSMQSGAGEVWARD